MSASELMATAEALVAKGKGILAADESTVTITKRLASIGVQSTAETRRRYRDLLFTTPGVQEFISGVILYDETIRQEGLEGTAFPELLSAMGVIPGIKVDTGAKPLAGFPGERVTEGLDGLRERLAEYRRMGARFAKWRAVIRIDDVIPTEFCLLANAHALARYAALCQAAGMVPIVEPEVLMTGGHSLERCEEVTAATLEQVFSQLFAHRVELSGILLKPNMVIAGHDHARQSSSLEVAEATVRCLRRAVPAAVPGIAFLSGGQSPEQATENLNAMNTLGDHPWELSFSYGRALQQPTLRAWGGEPSRVALAQELFHHRAKMNSAARSGDYTKHMEAAES